MENKYLLIFLVILLNSCDFDDRNNYNSIEKTSINPNQISLHTVRGQGDYLIVASLSSDAIIKVREYTHSAATLTGTMEPVMYGNTKFTFSENLGKNGKDIYVSITEPPKAESEYVHINAENEPLRTYFESVIKINFSGNTETINLDDLSENNIYLVKVNKSNSIVDASETGGSSALLADNNLHLLSNKKDIFTPLDHIMEFNANPPPIIPEIIDGRNAETIPPFNAPVIGDIRNFWVESYYNSGSWIEKTATLQATGKYGNIWVMDENFIKIDDGKNDNKITTSQAVELAKKFDLIYPIETNLFGYEYGGGPAGNGGQDNDPKVQILIYDIVDSSGEVKAAGFFWSKDYYPQSQLGTNYKTNLAEIFYLDASSINNSPDYMYSCLAHEFQHMRLFQNFSFWNSNL
jgi:hypothetical protein